jgi:hypothetical protein
VKPQVFLKADEQVLAVGNPIPVTQELFVDQLLLERGLIWTGADVAAFLQLQGRLTAGPADVAEEDEDDGD